MADMQAIADAIIKGQREEVVKLVQAAIDEKVDPRVILNDGLIAGMNVVGRKFKANEFYVPEVLIAARAMSNHKQPDQPGAMELLQPVLEEAGVEPLAKILVGTVKGDLHDIGKNLVIMMLKGAGFDVVDLGIDITAEKFVEAVKETGAKVLGLSALLTTTMPQMKAAIDALKAADCGDCKIMIGGAPVTQAYADEIGAQGYAADAASAVDVAKELLEIA
jgi:5-methyltetrahydrofolate--homocysteine methyltransferase